MKMNLMTRSFIVIKNVMPYKIQKHQKKLKRRTNIGKIINQKVVVLMDVKRSLQALSVTNGAIQAVDELLADLKNRGEARKFYNKAKQEDMRQQWITLIVRNILEKL